MKSFFRFSRLTVMFLAVLILATVDGLGQKDCDAEEMATLNAKITANYKINSTVSIAVGAAKEYLQKYEKCEGGEQMVSWIKAQLPDLEKRESAYKDFIWRKERLDRFDLGIRNNKFDEVYAVGAELAQRYPDDVSILLPLGLIGLNESYKNNFRYNDASIKYAKIALAKFKGGNLEPKKAEDGKTPRVDKDGKHVFGPYQFERNAENAISELTYALAHMLYYGQKDRRAGLLYYYEVSQTPGSYQNEPRVFATIGQYYLDESTPKGTEIAELIKKQEIVGTDEEKEKLDAEIKLKEAIYNGYLERAMDALSRAFKVADEKIASEKTLKDQMYKMLQATHLRREPPVELDKWIASVSNKPLPNPTSDVTPVYDPEPSVVPAKAPPSGAKAPSASKPGGAKKP